MGREGTESIDGTEGGDGVDEQRKDRQVDWIDVFIGCIFRRGLGGY